MLDYKALKTCIIKSCKALNRKDDLLGPKFVVDYDKLSAAVDKLGLILININLQSRPVSQNDVYNISEFLKEQQLSWISKNKEYTVLTFILKPSDEEDNEVLNELLTDMNANQEDDPDLDKVSVLAQIEANFPCYHSLVVSYDSLDPDRFGKISYQITSRANTVTIKQEKYKYNSKDMKG
jgi:hypothetical protein